MISYLSKWIRSSRVAVASDCQCRSRNCPGFNHSILRHISKRSKPNMAFILKIFYILLSAGSAKDSFSSQCALVLFQIISWHLFVQSKIAIQRSVVLTSSPKDPHWRPFMQHHGENKRRTTKMSSCAIECVPRVRWRRPKRARITPPRLLSWSCVSELLYLKARAGYALQPSMTRKPQLQSYTIQVWLYETFIVTER